MNNRGSILIPVHLDAKTFRGFAWFDTIGRSKRWRSPLIFAVIFTFFACIALSMRGRADGATLLGVVLLVVGLGIPGGYFLSFYLSVRGQIKRFGLKEPRYAYTVTLSESGVKIATDKEQADYTWDNVYAAYRKAECIYLYIEERRAYLLPKGQGEADQDEIWALLLERLPAGRAHGRR